MQDRGKLGIPGVRLYLDDGTFAITDEGGKLQHVWRTRPHAHLEVAQVHSMPRRINLVAISTRNAGDGGSRFHRS